MPFIDMIDRKEEETIDKRKVDFTAIVAVAALAVIGLVVAGCATPGKPYEQRIGFDIKADLSFVEVDGQIVDGIYRFTADPANKHEELRFRFKEEPSQLKIFLRTLSQDDMFVEVYAGSRGEEEISLRDRGEDEAHRFPRGEWVLIEFISTGTKTLIYLNEDKKFEKNFPMSIPTLFLFNGAGVEIDYVEYR